MTTRGTHEAAPELGDQRAHAEAADLLVIGEGEVDRHFELALQEAGDGGEHAGEKALHVGGAAPIEAPVALGENERIARPALAVDRHHVGVAGKRDTGRIGGTDGGVEVGLGAVGGGDELARHPVLGEIVLDEADKRQVRPVARRVEAHKPGKKLRS